MLPTQLNSALPKKSTILNKITSRSTTLPNIHNKVQLNLYTTTKPPTFTSQNENNNNNNLSINSIPKDWSTRGKARLNILKQAGIVDPYPRFDFIKDDCNNSNSKRVAAATTHIEFNDLDTLRSKYGGLSAGGRREDVRMTVAGRVLSRRDASSKLTFYSVQIEHKMIQIVVNTKNIQHSTHGGGSVNLLIRRGDIVRFSGYVGKTNSNELSIFITTQPELLTPCLIDLPLPNQLSQTDIIRKRSLALLHCEKTFKAIRIRSQVIKSLRNQLDNLGFIEVETPILCNQAGGAAAKAFVTKCSALDNQQLFLRIAPELFLKQMIIGGFDKIYEIGKVFRNESIDNTHNPEFTTCEFYMAYGNLESLFGLTEKILREIIQTTTNSLIISTTDSSSDIDFSQPFNKVNVIEVLEEKLGVELPCLDDEVKELLNLCKLHQIPITPPFTPTRIIDQLIDKLIIPNCIQPTFLYNHPLVMSPLAKSNLKLGENKKKKNPTAARFELFINKLEYINAYEELNNPYEQRERFVRQSKDRDNGDLEAHFVDELYCEMMSIGLAPTVGWGLGIDRLVGLIGGLKSLREGLTFPMVRNGGGEEC